ncbi:uncharacterized protein SRS1_10922 [Sporisorium reilianum f. sp. reilianum]|uniref:Uncharacterized protein n=1 Tax=Sporisorium reilianum f. sp. reilianum TaxID=72559 RepID=A0A2N8UMX0_9BASI|nr:uncharacterized protein SRS1_10922 [Sporisorium reilianum f. sp. reilianum]
MLFDEAHTDDLKSWLTSELGPICDADPEVLADYVLALLKHEGPEAELQTLLTEQLEDFLAAETEPFVAKTFQAIADKVYLPTSEAHDHDAAAANALPSTSDAAAADTSTASRKRRADHDDDDDASHDSTRSPPRQARRLQDTNATPGSDDSRAGRARERDSRERAADATGRENRPKQLCRDYHNKGFCPRGTSCKFEHSADVQPGNANARNHPQQHQQPPFHMMAPGGPNGMHGPPMMFPPFGVPPQGWHPSMGPAPGMPPNNAAPGAPANMNGDAQNLANRMGGQLPPPQGSEGVPFANHPGAPFNGGMGPGGRGGAMGGRGRGRGGGPPGTFQSSRRSNTTLVIENVPADSLDLIKVNEYFKKFGTITNISIDKPGSKALVSYSQPSEAKTAHESPDVIFGNRFVKVYFQRLDEAAGGSAAGPSPTPRPPPSAAVPPRNNFVPGKTSNVYHARPPVAGGSHPGGAAGAAGGMSEERKKLFDDQRAKQAALDAQLAEQKSLLARFGDKDLTPEDKKATMAQLKKLGDEIKASTDAVKAAVEALQAAPKDAPAPAAAGADAGSWKAEKEKREKEQLDRELDMHAQGSSASSTTDELKKKLEALKAEAASLGLDGAAASGSYGFNSRGRGRGGYIPRGRGGYNAYAPRGGAAMGANRSLRIDNRTTKLKIDDLPSGVDADKVKQHFAGFGELEAFDADAATVVFKARTSAEQALRGGADIPDVGAVRLSWIQPPAVAPAVAAAARAHGEQAAEGAGAEEDDEDRDSSWKR